jgi:hypothetical protein
VTGQLQPEKGDVGIAVREGRIVCAFLSSDADTMRRAATLGWTPVDLRLRDGEAAAAGRTPRAPLEAAIESITTPTALPLLATGDYLGFLGLSDVGRMPLLLPSMLRTIDVKLRVATVALMKTRLEHAANGVTTCQIDWLKQKGLDYLIALQRVSRMSAFAHVFDDIWREEHRQVLDKCGGPPSPASLQIAMGAALVRFKKEGLAEDVGFFVVNLQHTAHAVATRVLELDGRAKNSGAKTAGQGKGTGGPTGKAKGAGKAKGSRKARTSRRLV